MAWAQGWLEIVLREGGVSCAARMTLPSMRPYARLLDRALALWRVSSLSACPQVGGPLNPPR